MSLLLLLGHLHVPIGTNKGLSYLIFLKSLIFLIEMIKPFSVGNIMLNDLSLSLCLTGLF